MSFDPAQLTSRPPATVFDVGADTGSFAQACLHAWPTCVVHSFEPLRAVANTDGQRWHWHKVALGSVAGRETMWRCEFSPSSSLLEMAALHKQAFPYTEHSEPVDVVVRRLDEYEDLINLPALLKIDVQGFELHVLYGAGATLDLFDTLVLEVSHRELYHGQAAPDVLAGFLDEAGFRHVRRVDELRDPRDGELLQSDELWVHA